MPLNQGSINALPINEEADVFYYDSILELLLGHTEGPVPGVGEEYPPRVIYTPRDDDDIQHPEYVENIPDRYLQFILKIDGFKSEQVGIIPGYDPEKEFNISNINTVDYEFIISNLKSETN